MRIMKIFTTSGKSLRMLLYLCKNMFVFDDVLVGGEQHVELSTAQDGNECTARNWRPLKVKRINLVE